MKNGIRLSVLGALGVAVKLCCPCEAAEARVEWGILGVLRLGSVFLLANLFLVKVLTHLGIVGKYSALDVSNAHLGVAVYSLFLLYPVVRTLPYHAEFYVAVSSCATVVMLYLAFILAFVLRDFCMLCVATYGVTVALLWSSLALLREQQHVLLLSKTSKAE